MDKLTEEKTGGAHHGFDIKIVDAMENELPHDGKSSGEILIRGPYIISSYYNNERTKDSFVDRYWRSGDAGYIDENGFLRITDRSKDIIKSGGEWISSIDLEHAIMAHHDVLEAAVVGIAHPGYQERPLALVVLKPDRTLTKENILANFT